MTVPYGGSPAPSSPSASLKPLCTLNDLLWSLYLYPLRVFASVAPPALLYMIGRLAEPVVQFHQRRARKKAVPWIASALGRTPDQARRIARQSVSNNMFRILDDLLLLRSANRILRCTGVEGLEHLERARAGGRGVILLTGHFCANRIGERYLATIGYPALLVHNQRPANGREGRLGRRFLLERYVELQQRANPDVVYIQDPDCSLKILDRLRSGGLVHIKLDGIAGTRAVEGPLLGRLRRFPAGPLDLARLSGCAVVPMLCLGGATGFRIRFDPQIGISSGRSRQEVVAADLPIFTQALEKQIREYPEEWRLWTHL